MRFVNNVLQPSLGLDLAGGEGTKTGSEKGREGGEAKEGGRKNVEGRLD